MDIARLKKLAGIGEERFTTTQSIEQMMSQRYLERMRFSMNESKPSKLESVSYTHLTLPTILLV